MAMLLSKILVFESDSGGAKFVISEMEPGRCVRSGSLLLKMGLPDKSHRSLARWGHCAYRYGDQRRKQSNVIAAIRSSS
jgi:hypothetical protein